MHTWTDEQKYVTLSPLNFLWGKFYHLLLYFDDCLKTLFFFSFSYTIRVESANRKKKNLLCSWLCKKSSIKKGSGFPDCQRDHWYPNSIIPISSCLQVFKNLAHSLCSRPTLPCSCCYYALLFSSQKPVLPIGQQWPGGQRLWCCEIPKNFHLGKAF